MNDEEIVALISELEEEEVGMNIEEYSEVLDD